MNVTSALKAGSRALVRSPIISHDSHRDPHFARYSHESFVYFIDSRAFVPYTCSQRWVMGPNHPISFSSPSPLQALRPRAPTLHRRPALPPPVLHTLAEAAPGSVEAPAWALPAIAILVALASTAAVPAFLKSGDDAAKDMQERDSSVFNKDSGSIKSRNTTIRKGRKSKPAQK